MTKEQSKRSLGQHYNLDDKGIDYIKKLETETNEFVMCIDCQMTFLPKELINGRCHNCQDIIVMRDKEWVDSLTEGERDEYSQCVSCETVVDNEFISEGGLCPDCIIEQPDKFKKFRFEYNPQSKKDWDNLKNVVVNEKISGKIIIEIEASNKGWAWSALKDVGMNCSDWSLRK